MIQVYVLVTLKINNDIKFQNKPSISCLLTRTFRLRVVKKLSFAKITILVTNFDLLSLLENHSCSNSCGVLQLLMNRLSKRSCYYLSQFIFLYECPFSLSCNQTNMCFPSVCASLSLVVRKNHMLFFFEGFNFKIIVRSFK
jgi:hypothetical protein